MDKIRYVYIRGRARVGRSGEKTRDTILGWFGHVWRKDDGYVGRRMLRMELPERGNGEGIKEGVGCDERGHGSGCID